jgi:hypothetical protein
VNEKFVDISRFLGKSKDRISTLGVELEGGWVNPKFTLERDTSVRLDPAKVEGYQILGKRIITGEMVSPVIDRKMLAPWVKQHYPALVNETCGLHLHMAPRTAMLYTRLVREEYMWTVVEFLGRWAEEVKLDKTNVLWTRLAGHSEYCRLVFWPDDQIQTTVKDHNRTRKGNRYTAINYCYGLHQTVECRILPMFDSAEISISSLERLLDITNAFLAATARREEKLSFSSQIDTSSFEERLIECV